MTSTLQEPWASSRPEMYGDCSLDSFFDLGFASIVDCPDSSLEASDASTDSLLLEELGLAAATSAFVTSVRPFADSCKSHLNHASARRQADCLGPSHLLDRPHILDRPHGLSQAHVIDQAQADSPVHGAALCTCEHLASASTSTVPKSSKLTHLARPDGAAITSKQLLALEGKPFLASFEDKPFEHKRFEAKPFEAKQYSTQYIEALPFRAPHSSPASSRSSSASSSQHPAFAPLTTSFTIRSRPYNQIGDAGAPLPMDSSPMNQADDPAMSKVQNPTSSPWPNHSSADNAVDLGCGLPYCVSPSDQETHISQANELPSRLVIPTGTGAVLNTSSSTEQMQSLSACLSSATSTGLAPHTTHSTLDDAHVALSSDSELFTSPSWPDSSPYAPLTATDSLVSLAAEHESATVAFQDPCSNDVFAFSPADSSPLLPRAAADISTGLDEDDVALGAKLTAALPLIGRPVLPALPFEGFAPGPASSTDSRLFDTRSRSPSPPSLRSHLKTQRQRSPDLKSNANLQENTVEVPQAPRTPRMPRKTSVSQGLGKTNQSTGKASSRQLSARSPKLSQRSSKSQLRHVNRKATQSNLRSGSRSASGRGHDNGHLHGHSNECNASCTGDDNGNNSGNSNSKYKGRSKSKSNVHSPSKTPTLGFVNMTLDDRGKILTGVAPSGSSKTKARRDKELQEQKRRWTEAAQKLLRDNGGDVAQLKSSGLFE